MLNCLPHKLAATGMYYNNIIMTAQLFTVHPWLYNLWKDLTISIMHQNRRNGFKLPVTGRDYSYVKHDIRGV